MKTTELENSQTNVEVLDKQNSSEILKFKTINGTPFTICTKDNKHIGLIGEHRITEEYDNIKVLEKDLKKITWDRLIQVIWAVVEKFKDVDLLKEINNKN